MPTLYVTETGALVRRTGDCLAVTQSAESARSASLAPGVKRTLLEVQSHRLEMIALCGHAHITSDALHFCLDKGIGIAWFSRGGAFRGRLVPQAPRSADLRLLQYAQASQGTARLAKARQVVEAKLANAVAVLEGIQSNEASHPILNSALAETRAACGRVAETATFDALLGLEGLGARSYFRGLSGGFRSEIRFDTRRRRPPPDPANALLSFAYTLLGNLIAGAVEARGLDPALGFFHTLRPGRPSLALDLLEEFRYPVADRFVLRACNLRIIRSDMFQPDVRNQGGIRLTRDGLKVFFAEWEKHLLRPLRGENADEDISVRPLIERQVNRLAADLRGGDPYLPFRYRG
jgi:CRISP-associated protein Cas1